MGMFDLGGFLGGLTSGIGSAAQGYMNWQATKDTNAANISMNEANNAQNLAITQQQWGRDDNAIQRRTADMRAAGLNPVLAAGQGAQSSAPIAMQAGRAQAPQMSGLGDALAKGASTYGALVQAREINEQAKTQTAIMYLDKALKANQRAAEAYLMKENKAKGEIAEHDAEIIKRSPLTSSQQNSDVGKLMQMREAFQQWAREHPGVVPGALLDLMGGTSN